MLNERESCRFRAHGGIDRAAPVSPTAAALDADGRCAMLSLFFVGYTSASLGAPTKGSLLFIRLPRTCALRNPPAAIVLRALTATGRGRPLTGEVRSPAAARVGASALSIRAQ